MPKFPYAKSTSFPYHAVILITKNGKVRMPVRTDPVAAEKDAEPFGPKASYYVLAMTREVGQPLYEQDRRRRAATFG